MKFSDDSDQAAGYLRQAVPMMVKHRIVPNPLNYALWYSYFTNVFPSLNKELDTTLERHGTCPPDISESLFFRHISTSDNDDEEQLLQFQKALTHLVSGLSDSMDHTAQQTNDYSLALMENLNELGTHTMNDAVTPILNNLSANASAICTANEEFQGQLSAAQTEINTLKAELENSKKEANTDPLTGLYNRRVLENIYNQFVDDEHNTNDITLIMMDVDNFKVFNDTHGHLMGDQILKFIGQLLKKECKTPVIPVRLGGEEFALLCPSFKIGQAQTVAEDIRNKLALLPFSNKRTGERMPPVTASFGVAQKKSEDNLVSIMERADQALYAAKDAGRNQVKIEMI